jgi:hypothetical protein
MESSFFVSIENNTNEPQLINLFSGSLEAGVIVTTGNYNYQALQLIARNKGFRGNSLTTNFDTSLKLEFVHDGKTTHAVLNGRYEQAEILMDGLSNYIQFTCPPEKKFYIRLLTLPDVST